ncbi:MAG: serine/threonine-protein kinase [Bryobacteraceae bacterium]|jgi:serine/threonine-protein kinase
MTGRTILQYQLLEKLGAGGMGEIFKARDTRLNRFVAIKILPPTASADTDRRRRFIQEAQAASALNHPSIITIYDIIDHEGTQMMVMEYISGKTLLDVIPRGGLRVPLVLQYSTQMADALSAAHAAGIIHRDLKPANVMVTDSGLVKLLDFGLAKLGEPAPMAVSEDSATVLSAPLTVEGAVMGTVNYMSPEQAEGKKVDARSDIFSFGSVLYEMTTGNCAFNGTSSISTLSAVLRDDVRPIAEIAPDVPAQLEQIITRCLQKEPDQRWQSMKEVHAALAALRQQSDSGILYKPQTAAPTPSVTTTPSVPQKRSSAAPVIIAVVVGVLVLAAAGAGGWWWFMRHRTAPSAAQVSTVTVVSPAPAPAPAPEATPQTPVAEAPAPVPLAPPAPATQTPSVSSRKPASPSSARASSAPAKLAPAPSSSVAAGRPTASAPAHTAARVTPVAVDDGLPFRITLAEDIPASAEEGRAVRFTVPEPVHVGDAVVIAQGALVTGAISDLGKKKFLGMGSKLNLRLIEADSVDGHKLAVRATSGRRTDGPSRRPVDTGRGSKAKDVAAPRGTEYIGYIDGAQTVQVRK